MTDRGSVTDRRPRVRVDPMIDGLGCAWDDGLWMSRAEDIYKDSPLDGRIPIILQSQHTYQHHQQRFVSAMSDFCDFHADYHTMAGPHTEPGFRQATLGPSTRTVLPSGQPQGVGQQVQPIIFVVLIDLLIRCIQHRSPRQRKLTAPPRKEHQPEFNTQKFTTQRNNKVRLSLGTLLLVI